MDAITISKKRFLELGLLDIPKHVTNTEAIIYDYNLRGVPHVLKKYYVPDGELFGSKLYTVETLHTNKDYLPESFVIPNKQVILNGKVVGFTVPKVEGLNLITALEDHQLSIQEKIYYLKKIGELLEQLKNIREFTPLKDIYINDLQESNIIVNPLNKSLKVIDLDSCKIRTNSPFPSNYTNNTLITYANSPKYVKNMNPRLYEGSYIATADSDMFCYIMIILRFLFGKTVSTFKDAEYYDYLSYLKDVGFHTELVDCFERVLRYEPNTNPVHYLDSITYGELGQAREIVYKLKRKNK